MTKKYVNAKTIKAHVSLEGNGGKRTQRGTMQLTFWLALKDMRVHAAVKRLAEMEPIQHYRYALEREWLELMNRDYPGYFVRVEVDNHVRKIHFGQRDEFKLEWSLSPITGTGAVKVKIPKNLTHTGGTLRKHRPTNHVCRLCGEGYSQGHAWKKCGEVAVCMRCVVKDDLQYRLSLLGDLASLNMPQCLDKIGVLHATCEEADASNRSARRREKGL